MSLQDIVLQNFVSEMENLWRQKKQTFDQEIADISLQLQQPEIQNDPNLVAELERKLGIAEKNWKINDLELTINRCEMRYENATTAEEKTGLIDLIKVTRESFVLLQKNLDSMTASAVSFPGRCPHFQKSFSSMIIFLFLTLVFEPFSYPEKLTKLLLPLLRMMVMCFLQFL